MYGAEVVLGLIVVAVAVASLAGRLRAPAPSLLVIAGVAVGLLPGAPAIAVPPAAISAIVLPPLVYAAAHEVSLPDLRSVAGRVAVLSVGLVAASAVAVAFALHAVVPQVGLRPAFVVGAAVASTDPVAVSALARRLHLPPRLLALVQGESLFNDATSLVLFAVAVSVSVAGGPVDVPGAIGQFFRLGLGGAALGVVVAVVAHQLHRRTTDPVFDVTIALVTPYAAYVAAQAAGCSGVTAVVVAGFAVGARRQRLYGGRTRLIVDDLYEVLVFLLESAIFAVIGLQLPQLVRDLPADESHAGRAIVVVTVVLLATRLVWVFAAAIVPALLRRREPAGATASRRSWQVPLVVTWAGARGVVPLTAALSIPLTVAAGGRFPHRDLLLLVVSGCIVATLIVQGLTLEPLVRRFGLAVPLGERLEQERVARAAVADAALAWLDGVDDADPDVVDRLRLEFHRRVEHNGRPDQSLTDRREQLARLRGELLAVQSAELMRLRDEGRIGESARRRVQRSLDVEEAALSDRP
jgi:CPA1 family monovalent cation:H+ antiporter